MWTNTMGLRGKKLRAAITFTAVMGFLLFGYDQGLMSGLISGGRFVEDFSALKEPTDATDAQSRHVSVLRGAVTASYEIGCFFGAIFTLIFGERIGRTRICIGGGVVMIVGAIISTAAFTSHWGLGQFVVGRVISGLGNGADTATIPVWQSEASQAKNRGLLVCLEGAVIAVGTFIAYWLDFGFSYVNSSVQWRFPVAFQIFFALIMTIGMWLLPESPRWLVAHEYEKEAREVLATLHDVPSDDESIDQKIVLMKADLNHAEDNSLKNLLTGGVSQHRQRAFLGASTQFLQQFTGCNAAIYYSTLLFQDTIDLDRRLSLILGGVFSTIYMLATIPSFFMIEKVGRRKLFLIGLAGQGLSFVITFACLINPTPANARGAAVGLYLFIIFFAFTILPLPWIYPPEINPLRTRTAAASVSTCTNWITNFAVVMFTPVFAATSGWGVYLFFAIINLGSIPFAYFFYPETSGRHLEEVDLIFAKAHIEKKWPFQIANEMPQLTEEQVAEMAVQLGLRGDTEQSAEFEKDVKADGDASD